MNITIVPTNATPSLEDEVSILLPVSDNTMDALKKGAEENEYLCLGARLANENDDFSVTWNVPAMLDSLDWALARVSMPQVMGNGNLADKLRAEQRAILDAMHESIYTFLRLHGYEFFCQDDQSEWLQIGHWAQTKTDAAQFPQRLKWEAARIAYERERIRALQNEAGTKVSFAKDEHEEYEPSPYDGTYSEE
ncbi:MAG: hypothetical protein HY741_12250 [Chloroflexi bacterium]|nr:hypothetical protein [Chloroflexota bacterium]